MTTTTKIDTEQEHDLETLNDTTDPLLLPAQDVEEKSASGAEDADAKQKRRVKKESLMSALIHKSPAPPVQSDLVEGPVIAIDRSKIFIDLHPFGTGIIYGREFMNARDILRKVNLGDMIAAKVVGEGEEHGYIELSLKEARQALIWGEAEEAVINKTVFELPVKEANKGGLILEWQSIAGFLPASQLKTEHYPRVDDGDKDKILEELKKLVGNKIAVSIITADAKEGKLIFSEKDQEQKEKEKIIDAYRVGDVVDGKVTGAVDFGVFVKIEEGLEGLVHISELDWGLVENPRTFFSVGEAVRVKIIEIKDGKISLSVKALKENPWEGAATRYAAGDAVSGVVIKYNKHGALVSLEEGVAGLVHVSEFESESALRGSLELGKSYPFKITLFDPKEQRLTLSYNPQ